MRSGRESIGGEVGKRFWAERMLPYFEELQTLPSWQRMRFVKEVALRTGWAENTVQRQLAGLLFLEAQGENPRELQDGVSLMSLEAVAKIMRKSPEAGRDLLEKVLQRRITTRQVADIYKSEYQDQTPVAGGYKRGSAALASLYADISAEVPPDRPVASEKDQLEAGSFEKPVILRVGADEPVRPPVEIVAQMPAVARRLASSLRDWMTGRIGVQFAPDVLEPDVLSGRVRPLLHLTDESGAGASLFVHDGAVHQREASPYAFTSALARAMLGGDAVFAYIAEPSSHLVAELQDLIAQKEVKLDVRRERIMVHRSASAFTKTIADICAIDCLFKDLSAF